jgi:hypothetical protein
MVTLETERLTLRMLRDSDSLFGSASQYPSVTIFLCIWRDTFRAAHGTSRVRLP